MLGRFVRYETGISLLEVLISMLILGFGILGLAPMMVLSIDANSTSRDFAIAAQLAKETLEFYESDPSTIVIPTTNVEDSLRGGEFSRTTYIIGNASDSLIPPSRCKLIVVISWTDGNGLAQSTQMSTLIKKAT